MNFAGLVEHCLSHPKLDKFKLFLIVGFLILTRQLLQNRKLTSSLPPSPLSPRKMSIRGPYRTCILCRVHPPQFLRQHPQILASALQVPSVSQYRRPQSTWADTISSASKLVQDPTATTSSKLPSNFPFPSIINPLKLVAPEMTSL